MYYSLLRELVYHLNLNYTKFRLAFVRGFISPGRPRRVPIWSDFSTQNITRLCQSGQNQRSAPARETSAHPRQEHRGRRWVLLKIPRGDIDGVGEGK